MDEITIKQILSTLGYTNVTVTKNSAVVASSYTGRSERKSELYAINSLFPDFKFEDDGRSGYLVNNKFKIFMKPTRTASGLVLKPSLFKSIVDTYINFRDLPNKILTDIETHKDLSIDQKTLLISLVKYHMTFSDADYTEFKKVYASLKDSIQINTINNDFGEVLGPLAVIIKQLISIDPSDAKIFYPSRSNEPLLDYKIMTGSGSSAKIYKISAKSGDTTNTLKPGDVYKLIESEPALKQKYSSTDQYQVVKLLTENTWKQGPITALNYLKQKGYTEANWLKTTDYTEQTRQASENSLVAISKSKLDFTNMFKDATNSKVYYVKFKLEDTGEIKWEILKDETNRNSAVKNIYLRSKNFVGRPNGDKLGFQP